MAGVEKLNHEIGSAVHHWDRAVVADRLQVRQRPRGILARVERQGWIVLGVVVLVGVPRVFFLDSGGVGEDNRAQVLGGRGTEDPAPEALSDQPGQIPAVVQVGMGQNDRVYGCGRNGQWLPIKLTE